MDKAVLGSMVSVRYLGEERCVFLSKDLLTPIQVTLYSIVKVEDKYFILVFKLCQVNTF